MQDRLADLRRLGGGAGARPGADVEMGAVGGDSSFMTQFYDNVDHVKGLMKKIEANIKTIESQYTQNLATFQAEEAERRMQEMEAVVSDTNATSNQVNAALKEMKKEAEFGDHSNAETRVMESMHATLSKRFYDLMSAYQELKTSNNQKYREKVKYQVEVATGATLKDDELDKIIDEGDPNRLFANKILQDKRHEDAANALLFVKDRHQDIMELEANMNKLHEMFVDMAVLVENQGEMLDQIEFNVAKSLEHNEETLNTMIAAATQAKKGRKKMAIIICLIFCIVCVIILVLFVAICFGGQFCIPKNNNNDNNNNSNSNSGNNNNNNNNNAAATTGAATTAAVAATT